MNSWLTILKQQAEAKGRATVAKELGISAATISLVLGGKYPAATDNIEKRVMNFYGSSGLVACPELGEIEPGRCADNYERARKIGVGCGNPATIRLYKQCNNCSLRNG
ncbi:MAG: hypothetical protein OEV64_02275 [Desulfobulbaceae bacterium]|nr:hypothetical protein [Desulfobulbaceae bacterium]